MNADWTTIQLFQRLLSHAEPAARLDLAEALSTAARDTIWRRNQPCWPMIGEGRVGCVLAGTVRKYAIRANGQRQIVDLLMPGDFIGLAPLDPSFSIEAVSDGTRIAVFRAEQLAALLEDYPAIAGLIRDRAADAIRRLENHLLVQGRTTASEKVGGYLVSMCQRVQQDRHDAMVLPVSRYDIADHLGLAVETVSRAMTALKRGGMITLQSPRHVEIRDAGMMTDSEVY
ncbi:MAG TPA: helix-turn-helix domain-containing protein [Allosphingosinicella sp.]|nr:helix-turn-helix domain-containing protein [Allosphingosinicella sp.]